MIKDIFITGLPAVGKTSLLIEIIKELNLNAGGFYTSEIREQRVRKGFKITTLDGREGVLAHVNIKSPYRVSKYKVNLKNLEEIGVKAILDSLTKNKVTVIDEIGSMEMTSEKFKKAVLAALDSKNKVLGAIMLKPNPFCDKIKERRDTKVFYLTRENREKIKKEIKKLL
jgi:nucleoside-triphosphatase